MIAIYQIRLFYAFKPIFSKKVIQVFADRTLLYNLIRVHQLPIDQSTKGYNLDIPHIIRKNSLDEIHDFLALLRVILFTRKDVSHLPM